MKRNPIAIWIILSFVTLFIGGLWKYLVPDDWTAFLLYFFGWISILLAIGYYSTPTNSVYGKIAFACVAVMVAGIVFKIFHFLGANELIVVGLSGLVIVYGVRWIREKKLF